MDDGEARWARALAAPARAAILHHLRGTDTADAAELAGMVGLHVNTTRHHLTLLHRAGLVDRENEAPTRPGRPRVRYRARPATLDASGTGAPPGQGPPSGYEQLADVLAEELTVAVPDPPRSAVNAGRRWADRTDLGAGSIPATADEALARLVAILDGLGFAPRTEPVGDRIYLYACPFAGPVRHSPAVVCGVHLGLLRGVLDRMRAPLAVTAVDALVHPGVCVAHLTRRTGATPGAATARSRYHTVDDDNRPR